MSPIPLRFPVRLPALVILGLLAACAPRIEAAGPAVTAPELNSDHVVAADSVRLPLRVWPAAGEPAAVIVAVHGFNDYSMAFETPAAAWAELGITTYAYDQRGFGATVSRGLWPGIDTMTADLATIARLARARHPGTPLYLLGVSMGGAVVMSLMARPDRPTVDGIVLVAPAVWGWQAMNPFYKGMLWLSAHVIPWATATGKGMGIKPSDNHEMLVSLAHDPYIIKETRIDAVYGLVNLMDAAFDAAAALGTRTLVLYGENDQLVPREATFEMLGLLAAPHRIAIYPEGWHMLLRDLGAEAPMRDVAAWIDDASAPFPSGNERTRERLLAED